MKTSRGSGLRTLVALLGCVALIGSVLALSSLLHWYRQTVQLNEQTTCTTSLKDRVERFDYYLVTATMPGGHMLKMDLREPANQTIFRSGKCTITSWQRLFGTSVELEDAAGRTWRLSTAPYSDYDPRGPWDFWKYLNTIS